MSGPGSPTNTTDGSGLSITIVASTWHSRIMEGLIAGAERALHTAGATFTLVRVSGSFELPVVTQKILEGPVDGVVALGAIVRGGTPHFDFVADATTSGLTRVALDTRKPVGFGVLTVDDEQQGLDRAGYPESREDKGREAAEAVLATARLLTNL